MTRDELLDRLGTERAKFDAKVAAVPGDRIADPTPGGDHSVKDIVAHVSAYEELIVERLKAARRDETTSFDRDRVGWKEFNERVWGEVVALDPDSVFSHAAEVFSELLGQLRDITDAELNETVGVTAWVDPSWLGERTLGRSIEIDSLEHYPMHYPALDAAARAVSA